MSSNTIQSTKQDGEFKPKPSSFRNFITNESDAKFQPEADRYHLYISYACPFAHRALFVLKQKQLDKIIGLSIVDYFMGEKGWKFSTTEETPGSIPDTVNNAQYVKEIYFKADPNYGGRFTVPLLWDKKLNTIVNNESSEIIRIFNTAFNQLLPQEVRGVDFYPESLRYKIDEINEWIYNDINIGVYKSGFATTQEAYENNVYPLFKSLDRVEEILSKSKYLVGDQLTEADIILWTTIIRFDPVYHGHFKCNLKSIAHDYPHILNWTRRIYQLPNISETVNMDHIIKFYYTSHKSNNPTRIVPVNQGPDLSSPYHD